jgi:DNA-binding transcriptional regulator YhcF (GntR family)
LGAVGKECWDHGHCALSIDAIADEALVSHRTVRRALHVARALGLIETQGNVIHIVSPEWQALLIGEEGSAITAAGARRIREGQAAVS